MATENRAESKTTEEKTSTGAEQESERVPEVESRSALARWFPCLTPGLAALVATGVAALLSLQIRLPKISAADFTPEIPEQVRVAGDIAGRIAWGGLSFLFVAIAVLTLAISCKIFWTCTGQYPKAQRERYRRHSLILWFALVVTMVAFHQLRVRGQMLDGFHEGHYSVLAHYTHELAIETFSDVSRSLQVVLLVAVAAQALAFSSLLFPNGGHLPPAALVRRKAEAARMLYTSALFLTIGMLVVYALFDWPAYFFVKNGSGVDLSTHLAAIHRIALSLALGMGMFFSVILACAYLPTSALLNRRLIALGVADEEVEDKDLKIILARTLAILAPLLAALVGGPAKDLVVGLTGS